MNYKIALSRKREPKQIFSYRRVKCNEGENSFMKWKRYVNSIIVLLKLIFGTRIFIILEHNDILFVFGALRYIIHFRSTYGT